MFKVRRSDIGAQYFESLKEAKEYTDAYIRYGCLVEDENGKVVYAPYGRLSADILYEAKQVCDYVRDNEFNYGDAPINPAINCDAKLVSCDRMVGWVLYRLGYTDQPYVQGLCVTGPHMTEWCAEHGFIKIEKEEDLIPGDLCFSKENDWKCPGHTYIFASTSDREGESYRYDCGRVERIRSTQPSLEPFYRFMYAYRVLPRDRYEITPALSFTYDGKPFEEVEKKIESSPEKITYTMADGLKVESRIQYYPFSRVIRWTNYWSNPTDHDSGLVTGLWDCDVKVPFEREEKRTRRTPHNDWDYSTCTTLISTNGANVRDDDYIPIYHRIEAGDKPYYDHCAAGRSGYGTAPYFEVRKKDYGVLHAIGWTGQWCAKYTRLENEVRIQSGIERAAFRLKPGESFRTSSTALLLYRAGTDDGHNRFRHFMREISPLGDKGRGKDVPFSAIFWGGVTTEQLLNRWKGIDSAKLPFDTCWIDAGWYEPITASTMNEQLAQWPNIGTWEVSKTYHPDGYKDVTDYLHSSGRKFMVWFEPERVRKSISNWVPTLDRKDGSDADVIADLSRDDVTDIVIEKISSCIEKMNIDVYRQDFNIAPLDLWDVNEEEERKGTTEIKYINNLYRFWDTLLERFPNLLIDNCAGGGHRNDFEMLSRAVPMWRSDYHCTWDATPEGNQIQNTAAALWMPYSGIGYGPTLGDTYSFRSGYTNGMTVRTWEHSDPEWEFGASNEPIEWAQKYFEEYNSIRHYFTLNYFPLVPITRDNSTWSASLYYDDEDRSGIITAFRRSDCPYETCHVELHCHLRPFFNYAFTDMDTGETKIIYGEKLINEGLDLSIAEKRGSLLLKIRQCR